MKLSSSKSTIISPGRHLQGSTTRSGGRGGILVSPLFGAGVGGRRKRSSGSGLENNPEPSSPKVSCMGEVRVKTRKHMKKKMRVARSTRKRKGGGGGSNRRSAGAYQSEGFDRLVHLPVAICESIKSLGSELNCFSPCGSRPSEDDGGCGGRSSRGAAFTRSFVAAEETPGGKRREIELVVSGADEEEHDERRRNQRRRHVFDDIDLDEIEAKAEKKNSKDEDEEETQFVPPKNALLLMRCRSNPRKAAALANRVRLSDEAKEEEEGDIDEDEEEEERRRFRLEMEDKKRIELCERWISGEFIAEITEAESILVSVMEKKAEEQNNEAAGEEEERVQESVKEAEIHHEEPKDGETQEQFMSKIEDDPRNLLEQDADEIGDYTAEIAEIRGVKGKEEDTTVIETLYREKTEQESSVEKEEQTRDCLLMTICEAKALSDFSSSLPEKKKPEMAPAADETEAVRVRGKTDYPNRQTSRSTAAKASSDKQPLVTNPVVALERPRSSWSYVAAPPPLSSSAATEKKVDGGCGNRCEPLVLTRCKSEPKKSAAAKLVLPEGCFWKNMKMVEPHPPAKIGVGAAEVGF